MIALRASAVLTFLLCFVSSAALAQSCPEGSFLVNTTDSGGTVTQYCECLPGFVPAGDRCMPQSSVPAITDAEKNTQYIGRMMTLAQKKGWSAEKQARVEKALNAISTDGDPKATEEQIDKSWGDIEARTDDAAFAEEASMGEGQGFPGAGTQKNYNDCAIFALANAAGKPYSFVGTLAANLLRDGDWRDDPYEHKNPQQTIEQKGLWAGEVILLAEELGQAEVISSGEFPNILKEGRRVLINVVPKNGVLGQDGHEVVLTKSFQHEGENWYEMMDSHQGPQRRLYLSARELDIVLQEKGVAFRPEPGGTPLQLK